MIMHIVCTTITNEINIDVDVELDDITNKFIYMLISKKLNIPITNLIINYKNCLLLYNDNIIEIEFNILYIIAIISNNNAMLFIDNKEDRHIINLNNNQCISTYPVNIMLTQSNIIYNTNIPIMLIIFNEQLYIFDKDINLELNKIINNNFIDLKPCKTIYLPSGHKSQLYSLYFYDTEHIVLFHDHIIYKIKIEILLNENKSDISKEDIYIKHISWINSFIFSMDTYIYIIKCPATTPNACDSEIKFYNFDTKELLEIIYAPSYVYCSSSKNNNKIVIYSNSNNKNSKYEEYTNISLIDVYYKSNCKKLIIIDIIEKSIKIFNHEYIIISYEFIDNENIIFLDEINNIYKININDLLQKSLIFHFEKIIKFEIKLNYIFIFLNNSVIIYNMITNQQVYTFDLNLDIMSYIKYNIIIDYS